jgi:hypothetical protein
MRWSAPYGIDSKRHLKSRIAFEAASRAAVTSFRVRHALLDNSEQVFEDWNHCPRATLGFVFDLPPGNREGHTGDGPRLRRVPDVP